MNKKLMAVAVAGALAAPGVALAQASSVTISGYFQVGLESVAHSSPTVPAAARRLNTSQMRVVDNASRIVFNSNEDLGNGLSAVAQLDVRYQPDQAGGVPTNNKIGEGSTWVGLKSNTMGRLIMGRYDLHYFKAGDDLFQRGGALDATSIALFDFIGGTPIANTSRTQNVVAYDMPNFNGLTATIAWSANPLNSTELDMINTVGAAATAQGITPGVVPGTVTAGVAGATSPVIGTTASRKGDGWNINPSYTNGPFNIGWSYWRAKADAPAAATNDQRGDSVYGGYKFGGLKVGLAWNRSKLENATTGIKAAERTAWSLPITYNWGPNTVAGHYTRASNISCDTGCVTNDTGARMIAVAYIYDLSKRTALAATYAKINNDSNAAYNLFTSAVLGSTDTATVAGESPRMLQLSIKHKF